MFVEWKCIWILMLAWEEVLKNAECKSEFWWLITVFFCLFFTVTLKLIFYCCFLKHFLNCYVTGEMNSLKKHLSSMQRENPWQTDSLLVLSGLLSWPQRLLWVLRRSSTLRPGEGAVPAVLVSRGVRHSKRELPRAPRTSRARTGRSGSPGCQCRDLSLRPQRLGP